MSPTLLPLLAALLGAAPASATTWWVASPEEQAARELALAEIGPEAALWAFVEQSGLDVVAMARDMKDPAVLLVVQQDMQDAAAQEVRAPPAFFVNGKPLPSGGVPQLQTLVQSELAAHS